MTPNSKLLTVHIADAPEVTRHAQAQEARIESLEVENKALRDRVEELEDSQPDDPAHQALRQANAYANRH